MTLPIPAIDLRDGKVVRLYKGDYAQQTTFDVEPLALAERYADAGASVLHVVDLDGARSGRFENRPTLAAIASAGRWRAQAGGGGRDESGWREVGVKGTDGVRVVRVAWAQRGGVVPAPAPVEPTEEKAK